MAERAIIINSIEIAFFLKGHYVNWSLDTLQCKKPANPSDCRCYHSECAMIAISTRSRKTTSCRNTQASLHPVPKAMMASVSLQWTVRPRSRVGAFTARSTPCAWPPQRCCEQRRKGVVLSERTERHRIPGLVKHGVSESAIDILQKAVAPVGNDPRSSAWR